MSSWKGYSKTTVSLAATKLGVKVYFIFTVYISNSLDYSENTNLSIVTDVSKQIVHAYDQSNERVFYLDVKDTRHIIASIINKHCSKSL